MQIPVHNPGPNMLFVAGKMIHPGETRHFEENDVPPALRPQAEPAAQAAPANSGEQGDAGAAQAAADKALAELAQQNAKDVIAALEALADEDLVKLEALELGRADGGRKTVLEAISAETLRRAGA